MGTKTNMAKSIADMGKMTAGELRGKYVELFGEESRSGNRQWLFRRCAWRLQALAEGDLSERARARAKELARDVDIRLRPPADMPPLPRPADVCRPAREHFPGSRDARLPMPDTRLARKYKGHLYEVEVLDNGFVYDGEVYRSLSAIAHTITGGHWNGYLFFNIDDPQQKEAK
jgi:hypothetical protein